MQDLGKPVDGVLVEDELIPEAVRACLDVAARCSSEELVELGGSGNVIGMGFGRATDPTIAFDFNTGTNRMIASATKRNCATAWC